MALQLTLQVTLQIFEVTLQMTLELTLQLTLQRQLTLIPASWEKVEGGTLWKFPFHRFFIYALYQVVVIQPPSPISFILFVAVTMASFYGFRTVTVTNNNLGIERFGSSRFKSLLPVVNFLVMRYLYQKRRAFSGLIRLYSTVESGVGKTLSSTSLSL